MKHAIPVFIGFSLFFSFLIGVLVGQPSYQTVTPTNISQHLLNDPRLLNGERLNAPIPEMDILVRIVPATTLEKHCKSQEAYACTYGRSVPCTVYFPAGEMVEFDPQTEYAAWQNTLDNEVLPHEFLHCIYPNWHQPFTDRLNAIRIAP
jgi:hypothetical protein